MEYAKSQHFPNPTRNNRCLHYYELCYTVLVILKGRIGMEYMTAQEVAKLWSISGRRVRILCSDGNLTFKKDY